MKILNILLIYWLFQPFEREIQTAVDELRPSKDLVLHIKNTSNTEGSEALAVVFPELIRWSAMSDLFETSANELLYVQGGRSVADFSIGHFQMKPSFIEDLEAYITTHPALSTFNYVVINKKSDKDNRSERIQRLKQLAWQLRYAHVYWLVAQDKFKHRTFATAKDRIRFFATAYNYGFTKPESDIETWQKRKAFPFGTKYKGEQASFSDFAIAFYEKYAPEFE